MKTLYTLEQMIRPILRARPETRENDKELALQVWNIYYGVCPWEPVERVFRDPKIPSLESIGRVRRKLQERDETLRPANDTRRIEAQADFIEYANS